MSAIAFGSPVAAKVLHIDRLQAAIDAIDWNVVHESAEIYDPYDDDDDWDDWRYGAEARVKVLGQQYTAIGVAYESEDAIGDAIESLKNILRRKAAELLAQVVWH